MHFNWACLRHLEQETVQIRKVFLLSKCRKNYVSYRAVVSVALINCV